MQKYLFSLIAIAFLVTSVNAESVSKADAIVVAQNHWKSVSCTKDASHFNVVYSSKEAYIINIDPIGFVIVAADNNVQPVIGYSLTSTFDENNLPPAFASWLYTSEQNIEYIVENGIEATRQITESWEQYLSDDIDVSKSNNSVEPLLQTTWNQGCLYNYYCPEDERGQCGHVWAGCVSTAMGQIMKYWSYPETGTGSHSYVDYYGYGKQYADFGATTYHWDNMPLALDYESPQEEIDIIATLIYHCGVATETVYHYYVSGAWNIEEESPICAESAFKTYFGYKESMIGLFKDNITDEEWLSILTSELDAARPMLCVGCVGPLPTDGGHTYVCDGYDSNDMFHFNWGWGGSCDGFFNIRNLNPGGYIFNYQQEVLYGIEPIDHIGIGELTDNKEITVYPNPSTGIININSEDVTTVNVYDLNGKRVFTSKNSDTIDLTNYNSGIYIITITDKSGKVTTKKIVKEPVIK